MIFSSTIVRRLATSRPGAARRLLSNSIRAEAPAASQRSTATAGTMVALTLAAGTIAATQQSSNGMFTSYNAALRSGDVVNMGMPTKEPSTGIAFPQLCNGMNLVGVGVRIKYVFVKVYAVGTYMDPVAMMAVKKSSSTIEKALLDPTYPRTIRLVMNRGLSIDKYTAAIVESLEPRMEGQELESLEQFKQLNPQVDLVEGAEIEMTIRGDTLLYKNAVGGVGSLKSRRFCEALCDVYYGSDPVSPDLKESVLKGIAKL